MPEAESHGVCIAYSKWRDETGCWVEVDAHWIVHPEQMEGETEMEIVQAFLDEESRRW